MPLSPTRSVTVTPSDTVPLPQVYNRTSPFPALCLVALPCSRSAPAHQRRRPRPARPVGRVRPAPPPAAPDINHSSMYGSWQEIS